MLKCQWSRNLVDLWGKRKWNILMTQAYIQFYSVTWLVNMMEVMAMPKVKQVILPMVIAVMGIPKVIQAVREMEVSYVICYLLHN